MRLRQQGELSLAGDKEPGPRWSVWAETVSSLKKVKWKSNGKKVKRKSNGSHISPPLRCPRKEASAPEPFLGPLIQMILRTFRKYLEHLLCAGHFSRHPVIVVGDFNAIPLSLVYWKIKFGLHDCFLNGSFGKLGNTYKRGMFGARIDFILCSRDLTPIDCIVDEVNYSDHLPVIATIGW